MIRLKEIWVNIFVALLGLFLAIQSGALPIFIGSTPGQGFFPFLLGSLLFILGVAQLIVNKKNKEAKETARLSKSVIIAAAIIIIYLVLIPLAGYAISTIITSLALLRLLSDYKWLKCIFIALCIGIISALLFIYILEMPLPSLGVFYFI